MVFHWRFVWTLVMASLVHVAIGAAPENGTFAAKGKQAVQGYCGLCHPVPDPGLLDRKTWRDSVLPLMKPGGSVSTPLAGPGAADFSEETNPLILARLLAPPVDTNTWKEIENYFLTRAPEKLKPALRPRPLEIGLPEFRVEFPPPQAQERLRVCAIHIDERKHRVLVGMHEPASFAAFDAALNPLMISSVGTPPTWFERRELAPGRSQLTLTMVGELDPSDRTDGYLMALEEIPGKGLYHSPAPLRLQFRRPVQTRWADLDGDGLQDAVVCQFGSQLGLVSVHFARRNGGFRDRVLIPRPGAAMTQLWDDDKDGDLDIFVLMTQANEALIRLENKGNGEFEESVLLSFPPVYGATSFEFHDFNGDGLLDVVLSTGDNADFSVIFKPYHGIHIYLNRGQGGFEKAYFYPLDGAYRVAGADFDGDGDIDLASIAFFADFSRKPLGAFAYFENVGKGERIDFLPKTFAESGRGRWLVMDTGDVDGDGDEDVVLGNYIRPQSGAGTIPQPILEEWKKPGALFLLLRNQAKTRP